MIPLPGLASGPRSPAYAGHPGPRPDLRPGPCGQSTTVDNSAQPALRRPFLSVPRRSVETGGRRQGAVRAADGLTWTPGASATGRKSGRPRASVRRSSGSRAPVDAAGSSRHPCRTKPLGRRKSADGQAVTCLDWPPAPVFQPTAGDPERDQTYSWPSVGNWPLWTTPPEWISVSRFCRPPAVAWKSGAGGSLSSAFIQLSGASRPWFGCAPKLPGGQGTRRSRHRLRDQAADAHPQWTSAASFSGGLGLGPPPPL
jgi:hypothetical protein